MKIAIFGNIYRTSILAPVEVLVHFLRSNSVVVALDQELYSLLAEQTTCDLADVLQIVSNDFDADVALSVGGDGTFLNTAARIGTKGIPILGINSGRLGFLADVSTDEILPSLEAILSGNYNVEERTVIEVKALDGTVFENAYALNEVVVLKQDSSSMISINASVNGEMVHTYQADGLIVSTPTGSTAYSMSVGGPLMVPQASNFLLSPVASHSLNVRPLIIPDSWVIELEVKSRSQCYLMALDGRSLVLNESTRLRITKADYTVKIIKQQDHTFFDTLKNKLMWGVDKRN